MYEEIQGNSRSFRDVTAYVPYYDYSDFKLTGYGEPKPLHVPDRHLRDTAIDFRLDLSNVRANHRKLNLT